eukprot:359426-Chlamydomonas_euryale.AAC.2
MRIVAAGSWPPVRCAAAARGDAVAAPSRPWAWPWGSAGFAEASARSFMGLARQPDRLSWARRRNRSADARDGAHREPRRLRACAFATIAAASIAAGCCCCCCRGGGGVGEVGEVGQDDGEDEGGAAAAAKIAA